MPVSRNRGAFPVPADALTALLPSARQGCSCPPAFEPLSTALLVQPIAISTLSVCIALLCLSQSESLTGPSVNLHNLKNTTCQILPCPTQPLPSKLCVPCVLSTRPRFPMQFLFLLVQGGHHSPQTHIGRSTVCQTEGKRF